MPTPLTQKQRQTKTKGQMIPYPLRKHALTTFLCLLILSVFVSLSEAQSLEEVVPQIGGTFCKYLAYKNQLPRRFFRDCPEPTCTWDDWQQALAMGEAKEKENGEQQRVVLSYAHNGFGNQLWEHSVAFMIAESLKARMLVAVIPDALSPGGYIPPNTWTGMGAMERMLPSQFLFESLPADSPIRAICDKEDFYVSDRPVDWRNSNYSSHFKQRLHDLLSDKKPRCLKLLGYFQNLPLCSDDARRLWTDRLLANFTQRPGENDVSIYLRCLPRHYHFNDRHFYEAVLNRTSFDRVWLFTAPECPTKLGDNPSRDGAVASVVRLLREKYNATKWPAYEGDDDTAALLHDLAGLTSSKKLILPLSSWAFWAGLLSNATEIHVNAPPLHPVMNTMPQYIYHSDKARHFFGRYNATENDIVYAVQFDPKTLQLVKDDMQPNAHTAVTNTNADTNANKNSPSSTSSEANTKPAANSTSSSAKKQQISYSIDVQRHRRATQSRERSHSGVVNSIKRLSSTQVLEFLEQAEKQMLSFEAPFLHDTSLTSDVKMMKDARRNQRIHRKK